MSPLHKFICIREELSGGFRFVIMKFSSDGQDKESLETYFMLFLVERHKFSTNEKCVLNKVTWL